jgi:hypothetical protein
MGGETAPVPLSASKLPSTGLVVAERGSRYSRRRGILKRNAVFFHSLLVTLSILITLTVY